MGFEQSYYFIIGDRDPGYSEPFCRADTSTLPLGQYLTEGTSRPPYHLIGQKSL
jgi:hypothetical protein